MQRQIQVSSPLLPLGVSVTVFISKVAQDVKNNKIIIIRLVTRNAPIPQNKIIDSSRRGGHYEGKGRHGSIQHTRRARERTIIPRKRIVS